MLVLSRKKGQTIMIGDNVEITLVDIQGDQVRIGISAPKSLTVYRKELYEEIVNENKQARAAGINPQILKKEILRHKKPIEETGDKEGEKKEDDT